MRLRDYLRRIAVGDPLNVGVETLRRLHIGHREAFLFENLSIQTGGGISVDVEDQVVTLRGYAADSSQTEQLARLIRSVPGVQQIDRRLITDEDLSRAVTEAIRRDRAAAAAQLQVSAHDGTVDITGEAPDRATVRAIERVAGQVPGVQVLHNMVAVRRPTAATA